MSSQLKFSNHNISVWLLVVVLYWTKALLFGQLIVLVTVAISRMKSKRGQRTPTEAIPLILMAFLSYLIGLFVDGSPKSLGSFFSVAHFLVLVLFACHLNLNISIGHKQLLRFSSGFILLNAIFICLNFATGYFDWMYLDDTRGSLRYQFVFTEPSYLGLFSAILVYLIGSSNSTIKAKITHCFLLVSLILLSKSAAGLALCFVGLFLTSFNGFNRIKNYYYLVLIGVGASIYAYLAISDSFIQNRLELLSSGTDQSFFIRFFAPWLTLENVIRAVPLTGTGFGHLGEFITKNYQDYLFLAKVDQANEIIENTNIENIIVYILASFGIPLSLVLILYLSRMVVKYGGPRNLIFLITFCFFSGSFIGPIFLGLIFYKIRKSDY